MAHARLRHILERRLGSTGRALLAWRTRGRAESLLKRRGLSGAAQMVARTLDDRVARGPFTGLLYPRRRGDIVHTAKLLGAYELETHAALLRLLARSPSHVVNIGSGDGYYVAGIARFLPSATVVAVDPDPLAQRACAATARLNQVGDRVSHVSLMDSGALDASLSAIRGRTLCIVDCEGFEDELLSLERAPSLADTDILVETHDFARAGVHARLAERFQGTHDVEHITIAARHVAEFPELERLPREIADGLLDEFRHLPQAWLVLTTNSVRS